MQEPSEPVVQETAEERTEKYRAMQLEVFNQYLEKFGDMEISVNNEPITAERKKDLEKREKEELKKAERLVKKQMEEITEVADSSLKGEAKFLALKEKIMKSVKDLNKAEAEFGKANGAKMEIEKFVENSKKDVVKANSQREILKKMCQQLLDNCCEHYLIHQKFIDQE